MGRPGMLLLQMHKPAGRLDQSLKIIGIFRFCLQPEVLEDIVSLVVTLLIPALEKPDIAGVLRNFARRPIYRCPA